MFYRSNSMPQLKGRAAECRYLGPGLLHAWQQLAPRREDEVCKNIRLALTASCFLESVIAAASDGIVMPPQQYNEFRTAAYHFLHYATLLRVHFHEQEPSVNLFNVTIKFHELTHCVEQTKYLHPRYTWCYGGEAYMHKCKILAQSCARGTKPALIAKKFLRKLCMGHHLRFINQSRWLSDQSSAGSA